MKVVVIGTRGIPHIQGGIETHCEKLYPRLVEKGCDVTIIRRKGYTNTSWTSNEYKGVTLVDTFAPKSKSLEAFFHSFTGVFHAKRLKADILHIHAIGPALVTPLARLLGLKVVMTHHGPDYDRQKWNNFAKNILKTGEKFGARFSNKIIVISKVIQELMTNKYKCYEKLELIYNGVEILSKLESTDYINSLGLKPQKYILAVGRLVEEKGFDDLIESYSKLDTDFQLVIAGDADLNTNYSRKIKQKAAKANVVLTGFIKGDKLREVFSHASLYVLPSYHEGLPIALLEAMSYNLNVLVSNIPANQRVPLVKEDYFKVGNISSLTKALNRKLTKPNNISYRDIIENNYNWDAISKQVLEVYQSII